MPAVDDNSVTHTLDVLFTYTLSFNYKIIAILSIHQFPPYM